MSVKETIATYDRIAERYASRWENRSVIDAEVQRFVDAVSAGGLVLDIGCGPGFDCATLRSHALRVVGIDLSWGMLQSGIRRYAGDFVQADMRRLPIWGGIDGVWCNAALLHLSRQDAKQALREFRRVLVPSGVLFLAVKEGHGEMQRSDGYGSDAPRYFTYWQEEQLDTTLRESGFRITEAWASGAQTWRWLCRLAR